MAVTINAKGTSSPHFRIGKQGTTVYQGTSDPSGSYTTAAGDMWIDTTNLVLKSRNSSNNGWESNLSGTGSINITGDATITGNLTVTGTTTVVDTTNLTVKDPLIILSEGTTGTPSSDAGIVVERGDSVNTGIIWDESADEWAVANTNETGSTAGNVTFTTYANIRANEFYGDGSNLSGISTTTTLAALTDTTVSGPADNEFLRYNGSAWINEAVTLTSTVAALTDTTILGPSSGQVLKYNGSAWINDADSATTTVTLSEMTGDGSDTTLTLEATPNSDDNLLVFVDSVLQDAGAWSRSGTTLTFSEAPENGAIIKAWDLLSSTATNAAKLDALTADGSTVAFTLQQSSSNYTPSHANCLLVSIGGVMQEPGAGKAFTVSGSTITFTEAPATGATIWIVDVGGGVTVNTPADDSVTSAKIVYPLTTFSSTGIDDNADALAMTIKSNENIGIGNTSAADKLTVTGDTSVSGSVGIGKTGPTALLDILGGSGADVGINIKSSGGAGNGARLTTNAGDDGQLMLAQSTGTGIVLLVGDASTNSYINSQNLGVGTTSPEAKLHVQTATAGVVTPHGNADELVVENSGSAGMSFLSPAGNEQFIMFGDPDDNDIGSISYNHYYNYMALKANTIETMQIKAGNIVMTGLGGIGNFLASMGDDAVTSITPNCNRGIIFVGSNSTHFGAGAFRCESGTQEAYILLNSSGTLAFGTGALASGTSGTDGKLNVNPASDGKIYFNNRLGGGAAIWYTIVGAMW